MANQVYANNMEVSCKAADGKSICSMPDVCMTPPQTPATPPGVPIPYPNTGMASDCSDGSATVQISGQEIMLKDKSYFKKSTGDEAGCAPMKGVITSSNTGKVYFVMWSMDVQVEGENVVRNLDMTTGNHACPIANAAVPWPYADAATVSPGGKCAKEAEAMKGKCSSPTDVSAKCCKVPARQCVLVAKKNDKKACCKNHGTTGHHIPPWSTAKTVSGMTSKLSYKDAACVCLNGNNQSMGSHGKHHHAINFLLKQFKSVFTPSTAENGNSLYSGKLSDHVEVSAAVTATQTNCSKGCIQAQLKQQFGDDDMKKQATHNASTTGGESYGRLTNPDQEALKSIRLAPPVGF
jgi:Domain of unknown function (DUF4150)/GHH signature containing HNH/Endo VII superfamily nuclease toxin  2